MSIHYPDNISARTPITASGLTDSTLLLDVYSGGERSLSLAELKKTGVNVINVQQYGAVGDGVTDSWYAIQTAIDEAGGSTYTSGVNTLFFPPGRYIISRPLYITEPVKIIGSGWHATSIEGSGLTGKFLILVTGNYVTLKDFTIVNTVGSGIGWIVDGAKGTGRNIWVGGTVRDIAFLNAGCQQLKWSNLWASSNGARVAPGSTFPKVGFSLTSYARIGTTIADITNTGLSGLTLTLQLSGSSHTVTISGNHVRDAVDAINTKTPDSGVVAAYGSTGIFYLAVVGYDDTSGGLNSDSDLILTNGTGAWTALGLTASTFTASSDAAITNASQVEFCHAEGCTKYGMIIDATRHTNVGKGIINVQGGVFQGNDVIDVVVKDATYVTWHGTYVEPSVTTSVFIDNSNFFSAVGCTISNLQMSGTNNASFVGSNITKAELDATCSHNTFVSCNLSTTHFKDLGLGSKFLNCSNVAAPDGETSVANNFGGRVVNKNTLLTYGAPSTFNIPWGFDRVGGSTTSARTTGVDGPYAYEINVQTQADAGLSYTIPSGEAGTINSGVRQTLSVFARMKRTNAAAATGTYTGCIVDFNNGNIVRKNSDINTVAYEFPLNTWVEKYWSFEIDPTHADIEVILTPDIYGGAGAKQIVVDAFVISIGDAPSTAVYGHGEFNRMLLAGQEITTGTAAPVAGANRTGAIVINSAPTSGGRLGWVCTAGGTPGTWAEFASIAGDKISVEASIATSGSPNVLLASESSKMLTNEGATNKNYQVLPTAASGLYYPFIVQSASGMRITANTGDTIRLGDKVTATAGYIESTGVGDWAILNAINNTEWMGQAYGTWTNGTWTYTVKSTT